MNINVAVQQYKTKVLEATKILLKRGLLKHSAGHISVRVPETDRILIPGHIHPERRTIESLTEEDIALIDLDGHHIEGKLEPPGEKYIHTEIYKLRKDVLSVAHIHPKYATALGVAGKEILPLTIHSSVFYPKVPILCEPAQIDTPQLGKKCAEFLGKGYAFIQQGHGATVVGSTLEKACITAIFLEDSAELQYIAMSVGTPVTLPEKYLNKKVKSGLQEGESFENAWVYYYHKFINEN